MRVFLLILCVNVVVCDGGRSCLSCSAVEGTTDCSHVIACNANEVCHTHGYVTESGKQLFDFGCSLKQFCPSSVNAFVGRRSEGYHTTCFECCNDTNVCNQNLTCNSPSTVIDCNDTNVCNQNLPCNLPSTVIVTNLPSECSDITPNVTASGVYTIYPFGIQERPVKVHCIVDDSHIWTVVQQRANGSVDFYRDWDSYKHGFGSPHGSYWLGNDVIHALTSTDTHELMIKMSDFNAVEKYADYQVFHVGDESAGYRLYVTGYTGNAGDDLSDHSGYKFSTYDRDNDKDPGSNHALTYKGAWWFSTYAGYYSDLNGEYFPGQHSHSYRGVYWYNFKGADYSLKSTVMMVRKTAV